MVNTDRLCLGCMNDNGGESICPICGHDSSEDNNKKYLSCGTWLNANRYYVGKVIEEASDGVTYIAWDNDANAVVHIKEYFPEGIAVRSADRLTVNPDTDRGLAFNKGREEFVQLFSRLEATTESVSILRVSDLFESGGTVYAAQKAVSGTTLQAFLIRNGGALKWEQVKPLFMPLISTISQLNDAGIYHKGICPENIIVGRDGKLRLTGFCIDSTRRTDSEFLSQLQSGYAAPEQYLEQAENDHLCDIYSIGAVLFRCLIGTTPPDSKDRLANDKLAIPAKVAETVPRGALVAVANALKVEPTDRVGTAERLYKMLEAVSVGTMVVDTEQESEKKGSGGSSIKYALIAIFATAAVFIVALIIFGPKIGIDLFGKEDSSSKPTSAPPITSAPSSSNQSGYAPDSLLFVVPDFVGQQYAEVYGDLQTEYSYFQFEVVGRIASDTVPRGGICKQSVKAGSEVERDTKIEFYISLGSDKVSMPNVIRKTLLEGKLALFEAGFYNDTIIIRMGIDDSVEPGEIYRVAYAKDDKAIKSGTSVSINELIVVYYRDPDSGVEEPEEPVFPDDDYSELPENTTP